MPNKLSNGKVVLNEVETSGAVSVGGTLGVTGATTLAAALTVLSSKVQSAYGAGCQLQIQEEEIDCGGEDELAAVASTANLLPANSWILAVAIRCTEAFAGDAANFDVGDETTATRFATNSTKISADDTDVLVESAITFQTAASKIELLLDDAATAGKVRVSVIALTLNAATS